MTRPWAAAACVLAVACGLQAASAPALAQSSRSSVGDAGGGSAAAASRQLKLLCQAHRERLADWTAGGRPGRIFSPTSAVAAFPDDSPARYAAEIEQLCASVPKADAATRAELRAEREAVRTKFDAAQPQAPAPAWSNLPRRQAQGGAEVFDDAVKQQASGKEARERLAQPISELSPQAIAQQSRPVDFAGMLGSLAGALSMQDAGLRQIALQQLAEQAQQARTYTEGRDLRVGGSSVQAESDAMTLPAGADATGTAAGGAAARGGSLSPQECAAKEQVGGATQIPGNASVTASRETVMFLLRSMVEYLDGGCGSGTLQQRAAERARIEQAYAETETSCNQVQSGGRRCVAANHFGPGAVPGANVTSPYPKIPVPIMRR